VQAPQDHETVINIIEAYVAETENFLEVAEMKRGTARRWHLAVTRCMPELLRPEMRGHQVKTGVWQEPCTTSVLEAERIVSGENESRSDSIAFCH